MELKLKLSKKAAREIADYSLLDCDAYCIALEEERLRLSREFNRLGFIPSRSGTAHRNMLTALRMMPRMNTPQDWARLHAGEAIVSKL